MANVLKMAIVQSIQQLHAAGWSQRRIARELEIDRGTVARRLRPPRPDPNGAISPAGSGDANAATFSPLPAPVSDAGDGNGCADLAAVSNAAISPPGSGRQNPAAASDSRRGRPAQCEPYRALILTLLDEQLSAQRIWQDLTVEHGFAGA